MFCVMDRRQRKTREAIFQAFIELLSEKDYHHISVQEILDKADIGRATFYAHFETKDYLLKALCEELFGHIADTATGADLCPCGSADDSVFLHLLRHLQENRLHVLDLLTSPNNDLFLRYFKGALYRLVQTQYCPNGRDGLPADYLVNHIAASFVETVGWWLSHRMADSPEQVATYFETVIDPLLQA